MIGKGVRERSQRRRRENILFLTPLSLFSDLTLFQLLCGCIHCLRHRQNQTSSILSVKQDQNCCSGPLPVYQDNLFFFMRYRPWLACSKSHMSICQSGGREIQNTFPVICWVHWGPRTRINFNRCCFTDVTHSLIGVSWHLRKQCCYWLLLSNRNGTHSEKQRNKPPAMQAKENHNLNDIPFWNRT